MRKLFLSILLSCTILTTIPIPVFAVDQSAQTALDNDPASPNTFETITFSLSETFELLANAAKNVTFNVIGKVIPIADKPNQLGLTNMDLFNPFLNNVTKYTVSNYFTDIKPMVPWTSENRASAKYCGRLVVQWPFTEERVSYWFLTEDSTQFSDDIEYLKDFNSTAQLLGANIGLYNIFANDQGTIVLDKTEKIVHLISTADCNLNSPGEELQQAITGIEQNAYISGDRVSRVFRGLASLAAGVAQTFEIYARFDLTKKERISNIFFNVLHGYGNTDKQTTDTFLALNRNSLDGWPAMLIANLARRNREPNAASPNAITIDGSNIGTKNYLNKESGVQAAYEGIKDAACATVPRELLASQLSIDKDGKVPLDTCDPNAEEEPSDDVCAIADEYGIPCCQLQGIMAQETGYGTNMGSETCPSQPQFACCNANDASSACGPAQVLCGQYGELAAGDNLQLCEINDAAELLARNMLLQVCVAHGECSSYDWASQGTKAMNYAQSDDVNQYIAAGYFSGAQGCVATGCAQYRWGPGKTYCDTLKNYCENWKEGQDPLLVPTPTIDSNAPYMEFCEVCSKEYVRTGSPPLQCSL